MFITLALISAVQFNVPPAPLPNEGLIKKMENAGFLHTKRNLKELFFLWAARSYWWYLPTKAVMLNVLSVCLPILCGLSSTSVFFVLLFFTIHTYCQIMATIMLLNVVHKKDIIRQNSLEKYLHLIPIKVTINNFFFFFFFFLKFFLN